MITLATPDIHHGPWGQLAGASCSLAIARAARTHNGPLFILTANALDALQLQEELHFFDPTQSVLRFPDTETLPYDHFSPHHDIISERIRTLHELTQKTRGIVIASITTACQRVSPRQFIASHQLTLRTGEQLPLHVFQERLTAQAYRRVDTVFEHGEYAVRGSIIDCYPMGSLTPYRIEWFDDVIDTIRPFDLETQRSLEKCNAIGVLPAHEFPANAETFAYVRKRWRQTFTANPTQCSIYQSISEGILPAGIDYYLPLFFETLNTLFDYLTDTTCVVLYPGVDESLTHFLRDVHTRYEQLRHDIEKPILPPEALYLPHDIFFQECRRFTRLHIKDNGKNNFGINALPNIQLNASLSHPLSPLATYINSKKKRVLFTAESLGRQEHIATLLQTLKPITIETWEKFQDNPLPIAITIASLREGFESDDIIVIPETAVLGSAAKSSQRHARAKNADPEMLVRNLAELTIGQPVVHIDHGVGLYEGLTLLTIGDVQTEFLCLMYADNNKLYVPVTRIDTISVYRGSDHPSLHHLGSERWKHAKEKATASIRDVAAELLVLYAKREANTREPFILPREAYELFVTQFPFDETVDQQTAIDAVISDMTGSRPMDRLICGDVGFGKTEVAMRAAFIAVHNKKQVAVLVPTTLLAQQHYDSFTNRFANTAISIDMISRFRSAKEVAALQERMRDGKVDIIIGTHALLQKNIAFHSLGLLILDEEHRFGVEQKERLKALRTNVDILTLTATPIPRTLHMAFSGMRDLSMITTPPAKRLSIKTFVNKAQPPIIIEAISREILRGGQVFFLHNDINTIGKLAEQIEQWVPEARVGIGHGQLRERELERVMSDFYHRRFNVLVCTTIIETGIDIPSANTILIDRADMFGLAQLHQLRGRVGRSHHQAYAYLLIPEKITADAEKRLEAICQREALGSGFLLANEDLEIRGAGELLGDKQSGHMEAIGLALYHELLTKTVRALQAGQLPDDTPMTVDIDLHTTAIIPDSYIQDVSLRLQFYKRMSNTTTDDALNELKIEMIDRFGKFPPALAHLFAIHHLRHYAASLGIKKITSTDKGGLIECIDKPRLNTLALMQLLQREPDKYKLAGHNKWQYLHETRTPDARVTYLYQLLAKLKI